MVLTIILFTKTKTMGAKNNPAQLRNMQNWRSIGAGAMVYHEIVALERWNRDWRRVQYEDQVRKIF